MNQHLYTLIDASSAHRENRHCNATVVRSDLTLVADLVEIAVNTADKNHHKAFWTLEIVAASDFAAVQPTLAVFINALPQIKNGSAQRSAAKMCMLAAIASSKSKFLTDIQMQQIAEQCFDWLIDKSKVAVKVYAVYALIELATFLPWIHADLKAILEKDFAKQSPAYKVAARRAFQKMEQVSRH